MSSIKSKILFVCVHNSARSQMAEAFLNKYGGDYFEAESAGLEPGELNPNVVRVMQEKGIDISHKNTHSVFDKFKEGHLYNAVISVCDTEAAERCPIFPGVAKRISWSFHDPSTFTGTPEHVLEETRMVRDKIENQVKEFIREARDLSFWTNKSRD